MRVYEYVVLEWPKVKYITATQVQARKPKILNTGGQPSQICVAPDEDAVKRLAVFMLPQDMDVERLERIEVLVRPFV